MILVSPFSALSSALSKSVSHWASFLATSSYLVSASSAFALAFLSSSSKDSILFSSSSHLLAKTLLILGVSILSLCSGLLEFLFQRLHPLLILLTFVGQDLAHTLRVITSGGSLVKLGHSNNKFLFILLQILLKLLDSSVKSIDLSLSSQQGLLLLLQLHGDNGEPLRGDVQLSLQLSGLVQKLSNFILSLLCSHFSLFAALLTGISSVHSIVLFHLHGLHLLLDSLHSVCLVWSPRCGEALN